MDSDPRKSPFPFRHMKRNVIDCMCRCGHGQTEHQMGAQFGLGPCKEDCAKKCPQFAFCGFVFEEVG